MGSRSRGCIEWEGLGVGIRAALSSLKSSRHSRVRASHMTDDAFGETEIKEAGVRNGTYGPNLVTAHLRERDLS